MFRKLALITVVLAAAVPALAPAAMAQGGPIAQKVRAACTNDVQTLCPDVQPGGGRILQCLKEKQSQVSPDCIAALEEAKAARAAQQ
ncbi:cysteine rich repeat-containing protein [Zavarzinia compransoris]|uniref:cysteine rich repeat-containing protein n=1 Tax=Zavarzinia marina TaxID=2911065 RepID=UPI001F431F5A|nr:cysteine rich repeat-containing protein [Zavarzinia marina]MCF4165346.1 cysteine rich repeat-containing protein [Zavarzinia marina]